MVVKVYISLTSGLKEVSQVIQIRMEFLIRKNGEFPGGMSNLEDKSRKLFVKTTSNTAAIN
jgi:hypothetical protein